VFRTVPLHDKTSERGSFSPWRSPAYTVPNRRRRMFVWPFVRQIACRLPIGFAQARSHTFRRDARARCGELSTLEPKSLPASVLRGSRIQSCQLLVVRNSEALMTLTPTELRAAINAYLDKGPDFNQVRRHERFLRTDVHRLLARSAARDRRDGASAQSLRRRDACDERRRLAARAGRRH